MCVITLAGGFVEMQTAKATTNTQANEVTPASKATTANQKGKTVAPASKSKPAKKVV